MDREALDDDLLQCIVYARDGGNREDLAEVQITVIDVNDFAPYFPQKVYNFRVRQDAVIGTLIGIMQAFDNDPGNGYRLVAERQ